MPLWALITVGSAFLQNIRSSGQKVLKVRVGTAGATYVRFLFGLPVAVVLYYGLVAAGHPAATPTPAFLVWLPVAALTQLGAQALLVVMFGYRNFAVGTAYSRTEPAQAALFGLVFLGETIGAGGVAAVSLTVIGVMFISVARTEASLGGVFRSLLQRSALIGLSSGLLFGIAAVAYRAASLSLEPAMERPDFLTQAGFTLLCAITLQTAIMTLWIAWRVPSEFDAIRRAWRPSLLVGVVGATASFGWFAAMTLQKAAIVKALAQVEMLFTFASSVLFFRETINRAEIAGCSLIVLGIVVLALTR